MTEQSTGRFHKKMDERKLSVVVHSLFSSWLLSFLFEGQIFYSFADTYNFDPVGMVFCGVAAIFVGLLLCRLFIKQRKRRAVYYCAPIFFSSSFRLSFSFPRPCSGLSDL